MNTAEKTPNQICVHNAGPANKGLGAFFLYAVPQMTLHEDSTRWIAKLAQNCSLNHQRNVSYSLSHWFTYCLALEIEPCRATRDDLVEYKQAMERHISGQTGEPLSKGTIGQRLSTIINYYDDGITAGWNQTAVDLRNALLRDTSRGTDEKHAAPIDAGSRDLIPRSARHATDIRPLEASELKALLDVLGPGEGVSGGSVRDRLISEWGVYVGLRIHEILGSAARPGLTVHQVNAVVADPNAPLGDSSLKLEGKGGIARRIAVPNWLILRTQKYISDERATLVNKRGAPTALFLCAPARKKKLARGLSVRRYQTLFQAACVRAGLTTARSTTSAVLVRARHSMHDLRHTYAVMTYFAEIALGNPEPWKRIQAQLGHKHLQTTIDTYLSFVSLMGEWRDLTRASIAALVGLR